MPPKKTYRPDTPAVESETTATAVESDATATAVESETTATAVESETTATAVESETPSPQTKPVKRIRAVKDPMYHPFQCRWIGVELEGIEAILDSWIECQFEAGYLEEVVVE